MPALWCINPVIEEIQPDGSILRYPYVSRLEDPGRQPKQGVDDQGNLITIQPTYRHSSAIHTANWCLSYVVGEDLTPLYKDKKVLVVHDMKDGRLDMLYGDLPTKLKRKIETVLTSKRLPLPSDTDPLWKLIQRLGRLIKAEFTPRGTWTR